MQMKRLRTKVTQASALLVVKGSWVRFNTILTLHGESG